MLHINVGKSFFPSRKRTEIVKQDLTMKQLYIIEISWK